MPLLQSPVLRLVSRLGLPLLVLGACDPMIELEPDDPTATDGASDEGGTGGPPTTDGGFDSGDSGDSGSTGDSGGSAGSTGSTDSTTDGATDTGAPLEPICEDTDPFVDATVIVEPYDWPQNPDPGSDFELAYDFEVACTVVGRNDAGGLAMTMLECDDAGTPRPLEINIAAADAPVAWMEGEMVEVAYHRAEWDKHYGTWRNDVTMRRANDGALLLASMSQEVVFDDTFAPVVLDVDEDRCAPPGNGLATWNLVVGLSNGAGEQIEVGHQQRGVLTPAMGDGMLLVDVGEARIGEDYCCHATRHLQLLIRRLVSP